MLQQGNIKILIYNKSIVIIKQETSFKSIKNIQFKFKSIKFI